MDDFTYKFGAVSGMQNGRVFYQATVPFRVLASMLKLDDNFDVTKRSQRLVNKSRAKAVAQYLHQNADGFFVIPPLVGFIEGDFTFTEVPLDGFAGLGTISVGMEAKIMLFDGQHRAFGIRELMAIAPEMGATQRVSVMLFRDLTLSQRQQAFHDINFTQKTPAAALCIAYNERNDFDKMVIDVFSSSHIRALIEYEKNVASGDSDAVYSLKVLKDFAVNVVGKSFTPEAKAKLMEYVTGLFEVINIPSYLYQLELQAREYRVQDYIAAKVLRERFIIGHGVMLKALGLLGAQLLEAYPDSWQAQMAPLKSLTVWYRDAEHWMGRCVNDNEKVIANAQAVRLTLYKLKELCGLPLTELETKEESAFFAIKEAA